MTLNRLASELQRQFTRAWLKCWGKLLKAAERAARDDSRAWRPSDSVTDAAWDLYACEVHWSVFGLDTPEPREAPELYLAAWSFGAVAEWDGHEIADVQRAAVSLMVAARAQYLTR